MAKKKIIMDIDPGIDDSLAVILALQSEEIEVVGFTLLSGNVDTKQCAANLWGLLGLMGRRDIPIYLGQPLPLVVEYQDARDTHGEDGLGEVYNFTEYEVSDIPADEYIISELAKYPNEITVMALGPLTTMANIIKKDKDALKNAKEIRVMGGSVNIHGNCSPVSEYNFWVDPHAARIFFNAGLENVKLYPLDVTYAIVFTPNMREMVRQLDDKLGNFMYDITQFYVDFHWAQERTLGCVINDPLVIADFITPMIEFERGDFDVVEDGIARGESVCAFSENGKVEVAQKVDSRKFFDVFLKTTLKDHVEDIETMFRKEMI